MTDNIVSFTGQPIDFSDPVRESFLTFAAESYDAFKSSDTPPKAFILTMLSDDGIYNTYWLGQHSALPASIFLSVAITGLQSAFIKGEMSYTKEGEEN